MAGLTERIYGHFKEQRVVHFATVEGRQPRVRPMTLIHARAFMGLFKGTLERIVIYTNLLWVLILGSQLPRPEKKAPRHALSQTVL
jgi:hypothetical protein